MLNNYRKNKGLSFPITSPEFSNHQVTINFAFFKTFIFREPKSVSNNDGLLDHSTSNKDENIDEPHINLNLKKQIE
ncbi:hypothetical protein BpHYR1_034626, partial [Brachionus plicatilis]